jgi:hypothetical protein
MGISVKAVNDFFKINCKSDKIKIAGEYIKQYNKGSSPL